MSQLVMVIFELLYKLLGSLVYNNMSTLINDILY